jgi:hypothetical protein
VLEQKRELFNLILAHAGSADKVALTQEELFGLFNLQTPRGQAEAA